MRSFNTLAVLATVGILFLTQDSQAGGYGAVRAPVLAPGCATCAAPVAAPPVSYGTSFAPVEVARTVTVDRTFTQRSVEVQEAPAVLSAPVYAPARLRAPLYGCGVGASFGVRRGFAPIGYGAGVGFGTSVQAGRVRVDTAAGQAVDVRRGGLRGVLFGTRVRVR